MTHQLTKEELRNNKTRREEFKNIKRNEIYVILDSLKAAHNVGTILRLSDALLVKKVFICGGMQNLLMIQKDREEIYSTIINITVPI